MPTINLPNRKRISNKKSNLDHIAVYNTTNWKVIRLNYLKENTLCEMCLKRNKTVLANDVHHIVYISSANTIEGKKLIGFDIKNLMAVCKDCHKEIHRNND